MNVEAGAPHGLALRNKNPIVPLASRAIEAASGLKWNLIEKAYVLDVEAGSWLKDTAQRVIDGIQSKHREEIHGHTVRYNRHRKALGMAMVGSVFLAATLACNIISYKEAVSNAIEIETSEYANNRTGSVSGIYQGNKSDGTACTIGRGAQVLVEGINDDGSLLVFTTGGGKGTIEERRKRRCNATIPPSGFNPQAGFVNENP